MERQLSSALGLLSRVSRLTPLWEEDLDLLSEDRLAEISRKRRKAGRQAEEEARLLAEEEERLIERMLDEALVAERMG